MPKPNAIEYFDPKDLRGDPFNVRMNEMMGRVLTDREMRETELFKSVRSRGAVSEPIFVEETETGGMINLTGERRKHCARLLGLTVPAIRISFKSSPERRAFILDNNDGALRENWKTDTTFQIWQIFSPEENPLVYADLQSRGPKFVYDQLGIDPETATDAQRTKVYKACYDLRREQEKERKSIVNFFRKRGAKMEISTLVRKHIPKIRKLESDEPEKKAKPADLTEKQKRRAIINEMQLDALDTLKAQFDTEYKEARAKLIAQRRTYDPDRVQKIMKSTFAPKISQKAVAEEGLQFKILGAAMTAKKKIDSQR